MDSLHEHIYFSVNTSARLISRLSDEHFKTYGLSTSYAFLIMAIHRSGEIKQKEICSRFHLAPSTLTRFVDKLIKKEFIERKQDGKEVVLVLTEQGDLISQKLEDELIVLNAEIKKKLGDKYTDTLNRMLQHGIEFLGR